MNNKIHSSVLPELPGIVLENSMVSELSDRMSVLFDCQRERFPGAQPISFERKHIEELKREDYFVAEKSDGIRCLILSTIHEGNARTILIDRKNIYRYVEGIVLPTLQPGRFHDGTILDGELVVDVLDNGERINRFLVFDLLAESGINVTNRPLTKRLGYLRDRVLEPHQNFMKRNPDYAAQLPFRLEPKPVELSYGLAKVLNVDIPRLKHGNDGLIFTSVGAPYSLGTCEKMLKWKPPSENSIDFQLHLIDPRTEQPWRHIPSKEAPRERNIVDGGNGATTDEAIPRCALYIRGKKGNQFWENMVVDASEWERLKKEDRLENRIVECNYSTERKGWTFMRFRDDKPDPNYIDIAQKIMRSIRDGVEAEELVAAASDIRTCWKTRQAAPQRTTG